MRFELLFYYDMGHYVFLSMSWHMCEFLSVST